jgi:hypothetical protein
MPVNAPSTVEWREIRDIRGFGANRSETGRGAGAA